jgi:GH18 family chitinase
MESEEFAALKAGLQADGVKVVPTIQRFGWTEGTARRTEELLTNRRARRDLASRLATLVEERGFDGVNLDVEPVPAGLADEYVELVREVRTALDEVDPDLHLSVDVVASLTGYDLAALTADDAADLAVIMGYNYRTDAAAVAGSTAPLRDPDSGDLATTVTRSVSMASAASARSQLGRKPMTSAATGSGVGTGVGVGVARGTAVGEPSALDV